MEELSERLKELVTMKMNEAIEASGRPKTRNAREKKKKKLRREEEEFAKAKETVDGDTDTAPRSASSSEEFEFKTIQKAETADFAAKAAIERENKLMVSEAMAMIVREFHTENADASLWIIKSKNWITKVRRRRRQNQPPLQIKPTTKSLHSACLLWHKMPQS